VTAAPREARVPPVAGLDRFGLRYRRAMRTHLALALTFNLVACGGGDDGPPPDADPHTLPKFSFFVTSLKALQELSGNPEGFGTQDLKITVTKKFPTTTSAVYPEYDQLTADHKVTAVILFGQIDDGALTDADLGVKSFKRYAAWLKQAGYAEVTAPLGKRFEKQVAGNTVQIDLYSPREFSGLDDYAHFNNFQKALSEHEIIAWDGHSMLGASDFWSRPTYPNFYQVFLYGGCLGYEYYVRPILHGKGDSWAKLDLMSSVVEVSATANEFAGPAIAKMVWAIEHGGRSSWRQILTTVRTNVGDSTFGVSGVRDNCYTPSGSRCR